MAKQKLELREDVKTGILKYYSAIMGKGRMSGMDFSKECRKVWSDSNKQNAYFYNLFEKFVQWIEVRQNSIINARLKPVR